MQAIIKTGGKQYKVAEGETIDIEKINANTGDLIEFDQVLWINQGEQSSIGKPYVTGALVQATVKNQIRAKKVNILKFKRRKHHIKHQGHRQNYTQVEITKIQTAN